MTTDNGVEKSSDDHHVWRFGIIVPPANPTVEGELPRLSPDNVVLHVARFDVVEDGDLRTRLSGYHAHIDRPMHRLAGLPLDAIGVACTGCSYRLTPSADIDWLSELSRSAGVPLHGAADAIVKTLKEMGRTRLRVVSPYPGWLTEMALTYFRAADITIDGVWEAAGASGIYTTHPSIIGGGVREATRELHDPSQVALLISGTGAQSLSLLDQAPASIPILTSNIALAYQMMSSAAGHSLISASPHAAIRNILNYLPESHV